MKRLALAGLVAGLLSVGLTGCNVGSPAATVDGVAISQPTLEADVGQLTSNAVLRCEYALRTGESNPVLAGVGSTATGVTSVPLTVPADVVAHELGILVVEQIFEQWLVAHHEPLTAAEVRSARANLSTVVDVPSGQTPPAACDPPDCLRCTDLLAALPGSYLDQQARLVAATEQVVAGVAGLEHLACLGATFELTRTSAAADRRKLLSGVPLATVAQSSLDQTIGFPSNGVYGCVPRWYLSGAVPGASIPSWSRLLESLPVGGVSRPLSIVLQQGQAPVYVILDVYATENFDALSGADAIQLYDIVSRSGRVQRGVAAIFRQAHVDVNPQFGRWDLRLHGVCPPPTPPRSVVLNAASNRSGKGQASSCSQ